jgi:hypothetical protein
MGKRITVRKKADAYARCLVLLDTVAKMWVYTGFIAGHRANRLTRAERAVVKAAECYADKHSLSISKDLRDAVAAYERAKGGAR